MTKKNAHIKDPVIKETVNQLNEDLLMFLSKMNWDIEDNNIEDNNIEEYDKEHPFSTIFEALTIIKQDFNHLIKEKDQAQNKLSEAYEELARKNIALERNKEILLNESKKLELSNKYKSEFLANISHEIRTPLHVIMGIIDHLLKKEIIISHKELTHPLKIVRKSSDNLMELLSKVLELQQIEQGEKSIEESTFPLSELVNEISDFGNTFSNNKPIEFTIVNHLENELILYSDREKITQILMNLLDNAIKFTKEGSITVDIHLSPDSFSQKRNLFMNEEEKHKKHNLKKLYFEITDTGIGIPKQDQSYIFESFFQVDGTLSRKFKGNGIGLSICSKFIKLLEGQIWLESHPEVGTAVNFWIPIKEIQK